MSNTENRDLFGGKYAGGILATARGGQGKREEKKKR
jgi:hypothetical protein